jgi:exopolyphosphatase/guanosine-5'-triphosphate,3'-diphosphate pyrophosphatase
LRFFPDGKITKSAMKQAELAARGELQHMAAQFARGNWQHAVGSSGTIRAIEEILRKNGFEDEGITPAGLERLRSYLVKAGDIERAELAGLRRDRVPVLPGGVAILNAVFAELDIEHMVPANGAMRQGILYDLVGRFHHKDMRDVTVAQFMQRYHVDALQARRVGALAYTLLRKLHADSGEPDEAAVQGLTWAAKLHEIGISVAYGGYHKHSAYIVANADMPGFSRDEQARLSLLVQAHRRSLHKIGRQIDELEVGWDLVLALRLAALFCRSRTDVAPSSLQVRRQGKKFRVSLGKEWLRRNPLTATALLEEVHEWEAVGFELRIPELEEFEAAGELALAG